MGKYLTGTSLAGGTVNYERIENDFYATDPASTNALFKVETFEETSFLEPCCGEGHISEVIKDNFPFAEVVSTDLIDRGYGEGNIDFLLHDYSQSSCYNF